MAGGKAPGTGAGDSGATAPDPATQPTAPTPAPPAPFGPPAKPVPRNPAFDSFAGRLDKAWKKTPAAQPGAAAPPAPAAEPAPFDSYTGRLNKALKQTEGPTEGPRADSAQEPPPEPAGPVGAGKHEVRQGECISSIAKDTGHFWETIWNDPANADLRSARKDPNVLLPGDRVHVPERREKSSPGQTEMRHRFRRKGQPEVLRVRLLRDGQPRQNEPYVLTIDGKELRGFLDADGNLQCAIEPNARQGVLLVGAEPDVDRYDLALGAMDPINQLVGVQKRLSNLGFHCGPADGVYGPLTEAALRRYQRSGGLPVSGQPDDATRQRLQKDYGC
jgi:N-acetylmuramoyl-L-alanine amidase